MNKVLLLFLVTNILLKISFVNGRYTTEKEKLTSPFLWTKETYLLNNDKTETNLLENDKTSKRGLGPNQV